MTKLNKLLYYFGIIMMAMLSACGDDDDDDNDDDDDSGEPTFIVDISADPTSITEGASSELTVRLNEINTTGSALQIDLMVAGSASSGEDFTSISDNIMIMDGQRDATVTIATEDDSDEEEDETIQISINTSSLPENVSEGMNTSVTITITDNDESSSSPVVENCPNDNSIDQNNFECDETPTASSMYTESVSGDVRSITGNGIPNHDFRNQIPMLVSALSSEVQNYSIDATPSLASSTTSITSDGSPVWVFGIALNGVKIDPAPAQPFIFENTETGEFNFDWVFEPNNNMEAVGLDCAVAHVQPDGQYHYHGDMVVYADVLLDGLGTGNTVPTSPVQVGWAGDGFPIVYKYGPDANGTFKELSSGWTLKSGQRPGDGISEPCGEYNGKYTNDYEFTDSGDLDECNGISQSITIGSETFSYYYVITEEFPVISRCFSGSVDSSFRLGPG